jgi:hypothetical protein
MQSRASVINFNWGNVALTSGSVRDRRETAGSHAASPRDNEGSGSSSVTRHLDDCSDVASETAAVEAYNEAAFRYFLQVEEKRFLRSNRRFLLLLVDVRDEAGSPEDLDPALSRKLFAALWPCVRETDFVGWYRQGRVVGVACTQVDDIQGATVASVVADRFQKAMREALPAEVGSGVHVRSYFLPSNGAERS